MAVYTVFQAANKRVEYLFVYSVFVTAYKEAIDLYANLTNG